MTAIDTGIRLSDPELDDDDSIAHIVEPRDKLAEAIILGTLVEALCGWVFVPTKDPKSLPVCSKCVDVLNERGGDVDSLWRRDVEE